jgi:hypothetical protein
MNNYDNFITGLYDSNSPMNQKEVNPEPEHIWANLTEAYESGYEDIFKEKQAEILEDAQLLRYAMESIDSGLVGLLDKLITKLQ